MESKVNRKKRRSASPRRHVIWYCMAAAVLVGAVAAGAWYMRMCSATYEGDDVRIYVPAGSTEAALRDTLSANLGADFAAKVYKLWSWRDGSVSHAEGSYLVKDGTTVMDLSRRLLSGAQDPVRVTFNNVRTMGQLSDKIAARMEFGAADFLAACDSVLPGLGFSKPNQPAAFLPDTYEFYWSAAPAYVVRRLVDVRNKFWTDERRSVADAMGLTPEEVATVASIVEEESGKADERPKIARLYLNRLSRHMRLQADPTVKYAYGDFTLRRITGKHLATVSPYNTYLNDGLPPGPIRVVERQTLDDVLYAPMHDYIYMCAKEDFSGYHNFASTGAEHLANAAKYHQALNRRGIR